jgi:hypothetical protein
MKKLHGELVPDDHLQLLSGGQAACYTFNSAP